MSKTIEPTEPEECPYCGASFFSGNCRECGFDATESDVN